MKTRNALLIALVLFFSFATGGLAQARYVTDRLEITLRSGPGLDFRIVSMVKAGTSLEVIQEQEGWTHVKTPGDKEGWIVSRYVTDDPPKGPQLNAARAQIETLRTEKERAATRLKQTQSELAKASNAAKKAQSSLDKVTKEYEGWKKTNAGVVTLQEDHETLRASSASAEEELKTLRMEKRKLEAKKYTYWFLSGALVLLIGYILGYVYITSRGKKSGGYKF